MEKSKLLPALVLSLALAASSSHGQDEENVPLVSHASFYNMTAYMAEQQPLGFRVGESLTPSDITETLGRHNDLRAGARPQSSDMEHMSWDSDLAYMAEIWAQGCRFEHGNPPNVSPYTQLGQNIWAFTGSRDVPIPPSRATQDWYDEVEDYNYDSNTCDPGKVCGHYTQVAWASTNKVGCGRVFCPSISWLRDAWFVVCNYAPAGNYQGRHPYNLGTPCTQCASGIGQCYNGLCRLCSDHNERCECEQKCHNCGRLDTSRCSCTCTDGWWGADCSRPCVNTHPWCGANPGWYDATTCPWAPNIPLDCPLMCGLCKAGDRPATCDAPSGDDPICDIKFTAFAHIGNKLYAFQGSQVWRFNSNGELISDRAGEKAKRYFKKLPKSPAGAFVYADGNVGFVKGSKIYVYSGKNRLTGYPKTLQSLGLPKNFKATFHRQDQGQSGKTYFLKGDNVWRFDESRQELDSGYPKRLDELFPGIKSNPSGAFINERASQPYLRYGGAEAECQQDQCGWLHLLLVRSSGWLMYAAGGFGCCLPPHPPGISGRLHIVYGRKYFTVSDDNTVSKSKLLGNKYRIPDC